MPDLARTGIGKVMLPDSNAIAFTIRPIKELDFAGRIAASVHDEAEFAEFKGVGVDAARMLFLEVGIGFAGFVYRYRDACCIEKTDVTP